MTDQEYETLMQAAEVIHRQKMARMGTTYQVTPPPSVEVTNLVKTPEVHVKNTVQSPRNEITVQPPRNEITVTTKELAGPISDGIGKSVNATVERLTGEFGIGIKMVMDKLDAIASALIAIANRPQPVVSVPRQPKSFRLETDGDGVRRSIPEYED
jgi:hypothetical protein